jgi:hypothetical protein
MSPRRFLLGPLLGSFFLFALTVSSAGAFGSKQHPTERARDCVAPWGTVVANGSSIVAWREPFSPLGRQCESQLRICQNGVLTGSYQYLNCVQRTRPQTVCEICQ